MSSPNAGPATPAPSDLLAIGRRAAERAGELLVRGLSERRQVVATKSTGTDMVTATDREAERQIVTELLSARPDDGLLGEEGAARAGTSGVRWLIDPIDGTTNYLYGFPGFAVSIAAELAGEVVAGVVVDPLHGDVFAATSDGPATRNGQTIAVSDETDLGRALLATGFSYEPDRRRRQAEVLVRTLPLVRDVRRMGAAAVDLCSVACGRVDAYYEKGLQPWDLAAGVLVARRAGARVGDLDGGPPSGEFVMAATPSVFEPLRALLREAGARDA